MKPENQKKNRVYKHPFSISYPDKTAEGGFSKIVIDPSFDRLLSTEQLVNTKELAFQYCDELHNPPKING